ncbi:MAG: carboxypeptidase regulatory-like domain-containing protein, partial [Crocinitomicaceae bacterium]|nr:carboxypeptidase regulatory-like domain-containing protein [Crocinitomicaceae bacterium]
MNRFYVIAFCILCFSNPAFSQSSVKGFVKDGSNGDPVENAKITLIGSEKRCLSDANGAFELSGIAKGKYSLEIKASTFNVYLLNDISLGENEVKELNISMEAADLVKGPVVVTRKVKKDGNIELIRVQHNMGVVSNGISAEDIKKNNDSKVSDVMKRISGASIQDNKFIVIRGLSDRYNYAFLNGASLPSSESDRKAFSFDIFPSNVLSSINVIKTASPSMPGEFAGGVIQITTVEPGDKPLNSLSISAGFNAISTFKNFYRSGDSQLDIIGFGGKERLLPSGIPGSAAYSALDVHERARWAQKM